MGRIVGYFAQCLIIGWALGGWGSPKGHAQEPEAARERGERLFYAGGCADCHTDRKNKGPLLGGGGPIKTPFGIFYPPNISSDPDHGIGKWTDAQFIRALRDGVAPSGANYYPAFPYTSFTNMTDGDMLAIKAHILSLPPVARSSRPHDVPFPYSVRLGLSLWKALYLHKGPLAPDPSKSQEWNRGRYLAEGVVHCAECHTNRTALGGLDRDRWMGGAQKGKGPDGEATPNITPDPKSGIGKWTVEQIVQALKTGDMPDGDTFGSLMADVVEHGTSRLSDADRHAIAVYIKSLKPVARKKSR